jgi:hypothetical protein
MLMLMLASTSAGVLRWIDSSQRELRSGSAWLVVEEQRKDRQHTPILGEEVAEDVDCVPFLHVPKGGL